MNSSVFYRRVKSPAFSAILGQREMTRAVVETIANEVSALSERMVKLGRGAGGAPDSTRSASAAFARRGMQHRAVSQLREAVLGTAPVYWTRYVRTLSPRGSPASQWPVLAQAHCWKP
jgi:hypothetical protein